MKSKSNVVGLFLFLLGSMIAYGQNDRTSAEQFRKDQEMMRRTALLRTMDSAVVYMNQGEYELADQRFLYVLNNIKGVPSDLTFFFGKNSYYLNRYKQSIDWINKYIQLKGTSGQYSAEALDIMKKAEAELLKERTANAAKAREVMAKDYEIDCGPTGKVICPVCKGNTVIVTRGSFGNQYKTCQFCDQHGLLTCDEYNRLLRGELQPKNQ